MKSLEEVIKQNKFKNLNEKVIVNIFYTANWLRDVNNNLISKYKISMQQYNILRILRGQYPSCATVNLIRERMLDKNSGVSRMVEKMRLKGLVERHLNCDDRRQVDVIITQKGLDILSEIDTKLTEVQKMVESLTVKEREKLNFLLDKLRAEN